MRWVLLALLAALAITFAALKLRRRPFFTRFVEAFKGIATQLRRTPRQVLLGCSIGFASQLLVCYLLLLCLSAIAYPEIPCLSLLWAFPLIAAVAALPFSIGGSGLRESAAVLLLQGCGVAAEQIVVGGFLVLSIYILWAVIGLPVLLWEEHRHGRATR